MVIRIVLMLALGCVASPGAYGDDEPVVEVFVKSHRFHGIHGITPGPGGRLYVGSVVGQSIYAVDPDSGDWEVWQGPPLGMADDIEPAPDGRLIWTSFLLGKIHARKGDGPVEELATDLPGINSLAFRQDGRLFATQVFLADALYEIDPAGVAAPRKIMEGMGGLNGFDFGPDGYLYGPLWFKGQVARVDVDTAELTVVAEGFGIPSAANFNSKGELFVLDAGRGEVVRVDPDTGGKSLIATLRSGLDNLAFDADDRMFVTGMAEGAVFEVDTDTGTVRTILDGSLGVPTDLAVFGDTLYVADTFALRAVDIATGETRAVSRVPELEYAFGIDATEERIHTSSWFNSAVQTFDRNTGALLATYHNIPTAYDVLEVDNVLYVLQMFPGSIVRLDGHGEDERSTVARGLSGATAMVRAGNGNVYVTLYGKGQVVRVDLASGDSEVVAEGLSEPEGIAVAADGTIIVSEPKAGRVMRIDPKTGETKILAEGLSLYFEMAQGLPPMGATTGVAVDAAGSIYVSSENDIAIYRIHSK